MLLGFILPFALAFIAIPLESLIHAARTVGGVLLYSVVRAMAFVLRLASAIAKHMSRVLIRLYDVAIVLPLLGIELPLVKTMIAVTFIAGLVPVLGNLVSNAVVVIVSLSVSPYVALGSLIYLVAIHKLEYFLNARLVGTRIEAGAWELLLAMLLMEAAFGVAGLIAAPIYYAYLKDELMGAGWV
jgi:hypothetical protein